MSARTTRGRRALAGAAMLALTAGLVACAPAGADPDTTQPASPGGSSDDGDTGDADGGTFTVGFLSPVTGPVAAAGTEMREGWELYWEQKGNESAGVTIKTVFEDDAGNPDTALTKAKRLVEDEEVDILVGPLLANTALAVADYAVQAGVPNLHPVAAADDLTQRKADPLVVRTGSYTGSQMNYAAGDWAYKQGHRTAITICPDYAFGWESCAGFARTFTDAGGEVTDQLWFPLGTQDFSTYVSQIAASGADMVYAATAGGADGTNFVKSFVEFGVKDQMPILTNCCTVDQANLTALGDMALGIHSVSYWAEGRDAPEVAEFLELYEEQYGKIPSINVAGAYLTAYLVDTALQATDGKARGTDLTDAIRQVDVSDTVYGALTFDDYSNPVGPIYVREVQTRDDGKLWNVPIETYDAVSQFWDYGADAVLADPPYSRDNTGR